MFIYDNTPRADEDLIQTAWMKALERTKERPQARTTEELREKYQHIAGLVVHIYQAEKVNHNRKKACLSLPEDLPVEYDMISHLIDCTPEEREAIDFYLSLVQQKTPLTIAQKVRLTRYRKKTGLALNLNY